MYLVLTKPPKMKYLFLFLTLSFVACTSTKPVKKFSINPNLKEYSGIFGTSTTGAIYKMPNEPKNYQIDTSNYLAFNELKLVDKSLGQVTGQPTLNLVFNDKGKKQLEDLTIKYLKQPLLFIVNNKLIMAPIVQEKISGGSVQISGHFTLEEIDAIYQQLVLKEKE